MAFVVNDRVQEFTSTTGTGTLTLTGSPDGFETFSSAVGDGNTTYYTISSNTTEFEVGIGTVGAGTLSRDTVISSSNSDALVNFSAGTKNVFVTLPASKTILLNDSDTVDLTGNLDLNSNDITGTGNINITGNLTASGNLTSLGIDDNATSTAITIDSSQNVNIGGDLSSESIELGGAPNAFGTNISNAYIFKTGATGSAPFNQAGALLYQPRTTTTEGRSNHLFYTGSPLALRQNIHPNGDISFYEDTGTTAKLFWDSSTERLGIGTASPVGKLHIQSSASDQIYLNGTSGDAFGLWVSDTGTTFSLGTWGVGERIIIDNSGNTLQFQTGGSERMRIDSSGDVQIGSTNSGVGGLIDLSIGNTSSSGGITLWATTTASHSIGFGDGYTGTDRYRGYLEYAHNGDSMRFATSATERMRIDSSGNVGIGTTAPADYYADNLVVNAQSEGGITLIGTSAHENYLAWADGTSGTERYSGYLSYNHSSNFMRFATNGGLERMRITSAGNVGIGTSSPNGSDFGSGTGLVHLKDIGATNTGIKLEQGAGKSFWYQNETDTYFGSGSSNPLRIYTGLTERMRIDSSGNVGIGTTAPDAKLSVNGVASFGDGTALLPSIANFGDLDTGMWFPAADTIAFSEGGVEAMRITSAGNVGIGTTTPTTGSDYGNLSLNGTLGGQLAFHTGGTGKQYIYSSSTDLNIYNSIAGNLIFHTNSTERMRINSSGNVGIGTSSPDAKLHVNGLIEANGSLYRGIFGGAVQDGDMTGATGGNGSEVQIQSPSSIRPASLTLGGSLGNNELLGVIGFYNSGNTDGKRLRAYIRSGQEGATANEQGALMVFSTASDAASTPTERMRIDSSGRCTYTIQHQLH
jgi:hypothetical protein